MEEDTVYKALLKADIGKLHPSGSEAALVKDLVSQFLGHDGYVQTARSFTLECDAETADLKRTPAPTSLPPNTHDVDAVNRQRKSQSWFYAFNFTHVLRNPFRSPQRRH